MTDAPRSVAVCLVLIVVLFASVTLADDFKTIDGKEYKNATVSSVEPDGIVLTSKSGISKVYFVELPKDVQQRFHYDAARSAQFTSEQQAAVAESNAVVTVQQQEEAQERQLRAETAARVQQQVAEQQRQSDAIAVQQQDRHLQAQQKQAAKIAAQKQAREQHQRSRTTTGGDGGSSWSSTTYLPYGGYQTIQHSGNARAGNYHVETHGPRSPNSAWTDNSTDTSWGHWGHASKRNKPKKHETPPP